MSRSLIPPEALRAMIDCARQAPRAAIVEVGVYRGGSAIELAKIATEKNVHLWLYDTFEGMPFAGPDDKHPAGDFADTSLGYVQTLVPNATLVKGIFPASLVHKPPLSFVHCDVDQYQSTRDVIDHLWPLLVSGGVMWFDDCELEPAMRAIDESPQFEILFKAPAGRHYAVKP